MITQQTLSLSLVTPFETYVDCTVTAPDEPVKVTDATFERCHFAGSLTHEEWLDCTFTDCDLANQRWDDSVLYRCHLTGCNLLGISFLNNQWKDTTVTTGRGDYLNLSGAKLTACTFTETSLKEAYFRDVQVVKGLTMTRCDLEQASFWESKLAGVDLSTSTFDQLEVDARADSLKGLILNGFQAATVLSLFGVRIK